MNNSSKSNIKYFFSIFGISTKWKWLLVALFIFGFISIGASIIGPKFLGYATDELIIIFQDNLGKSEFWKIDQFLLIAIALYVFSNLFSYLQNQAGIILSQKIGYYLRERLALKISKLPYLYFETKSTGDIISIFTNDVDLIGGNFSSVLVSLIATFGSIFGIFIAMLTLNVYIAIFLFVITVVIFIIVIIIVKFSQRYFISQQDRLGQINGFINESYDSQEIILAYNSENAFNATFNKINDALFRDGLYSSFFSRLIFTINNVFYLISFSVIILLGAKLILNNVLTIGDLQTFLMYSFLITLPVSQICTVISLGQQIAAASKRIFEFLSESDLNVENQIITKDCISNLDININKLNFSYKPDSLVLKDVSLNIPEGSKIAIVGHTGSGKTTLIKLLLGFYDNYEGFIKLGDTEIKNIYKNDLREIIGVIPQDVWLHAGTIAQNISFEIDNIDYEKVKWAAKMACIDSFIENLEDSYDYVIDDNIENLSLGQLQMINIARAFYTDKKIIIFDEATSYIDSHTESLLQKAIDNLSKNKTVIGIAHRLVNVKRVDNIYVVNNGSIIEQGSHDELLNKKGEYYKLYNSRC